MPANKEVTRNVALKSGNQCAFPGCDEFIYDEQEGLFLGELAHIEAESSDGPRYNPKQTDKERNGAANVMFMCRKHHRIIDRKPKHYTVELLIKMKSDHENNIKKSSKKVVDSIVKGFQDYLRENETSIDLSSAKGFIKWLKGCEYSKKEVQKELNEISYCIDNIHEFKEDTQSFIFNLLVHGNSNGTSLNVATERSKNIDDERIYNIVKFLTGAGVIEDIQNYDLMVQVQDLDNDITYKIANGVWVFKGRYTSLYSLKNF